LLYFSCCKSALHLAKEVVELGAAELAQGQQEQARQGPAVAREERVPQLAAAEMPSAAARRPARLVEVPQRER
jgi:hypothetical protein